MTDDTEVLVKWVLGVVIAVPVVSFAIGFCLAMWILN